MDIEQALRAAGLTEKQSKVYLSLLKLGRASAQVLAKDSGLKTSTAYVIVDQLCDLGVVYLIPKVKKKLYRPLSPHLLFERATNRLSLATKTLPKIESLLQGPSSKPQVLYFEGARGEEELLDYRLNEIQNEELVGFYAKSHEAPASSYDRYRKHNQKRKKLNVSSRGIAPDDPELNEFRAEDKSLNRETKKVSVSEYDSNVYVEVASDFVRIGDPVHEQGLIIDNPEIARTFRQIFEMLWNRI